MTWELLSIGDVILIHDEVLNLGELEGFAGDKSLDGAIARVENRINYNLITDEYHLATTYAMAIATGHCFNDGNKRTALAVLLVCLDRNNIDARWDGQELADQIIDLAQGKIDEDRLAQWLRRHAR